MDIISFYDSCLEDTFLVSEKASRALDAFSARCQEQGFTCKWAQNRLELSVAIRRSLGVEVGGFIALDPTNHQLIIRVFTVSQRKPDRLYTTSVLRLVHDLNAETNSYILKIDPCNAQLAIESSILFGSHDPLNPCPFDLFDLLADQFNLLQIKLLGCYHKIQAIRNCSCEDLELAESPLKADLSKLKKYITASPHYAWSILEPNKQANNSSQFTVMKRAYRKIRPCEATDLKRRFSSLLSNIMCEPIPVVEKFFHLTKPEDDQIVSRYLNPESQPIPESECSIEFVNQNNFTPTQLYKSETLCIGNKKVRVRLMSPQLVSRELYIVSHLPKQKHKSIPKYVAFKQIAKEQQNFILTQDHIDVIKYTRYLEANKNILSVNTLLFLLADVAKALVYLRDNDIVYNNLIPSNIKISKGLNIVLEDLSNAYHTSMQDKLTRTPQDEGFSEPVNKLPYVSHKNFNDAQSHLSESSDVYSFGVLMFRSLFNKNLFPTKQSSLSFGKMAARAPTIATDGLADYKMDHFKLLAHFALKAATHNIVNPECPARQAEGETQGIKSTGSHKELGEKRPNMDWLAVVSQATLSYFDSNLARQMSEQESIKIEQEIRKRMERELIQH